MKKTSKILSLFLVIVMLLSVLPISASAAEIGTVSTVTISDVVAPVDNASAAYNCSVAEESCFIYEMFWAELETSPIDYDAIDEAAWYSTKEELVFSEGYYYAAIFDIDPEEFYVFSEDFTATVNGDAATFIDYYDGSPYIYYVYYLSETGATPIVPPTPPTLIEIERVDITLNLNCVGINPETQWDEIYTIETDHVSYDNSIDGYRGVWVYDDYNNYNEATEIVEGIAYFLYFCIAADTGYTFSDDVEIYINGRLLDQEGYYDYFDDSTGFYTLCFNLEDIEFSEDYAPILEYIYVDTVPYDAACQYKSEISLDGLRVIAVYSNNTEIDVTVDVTVTGFDSMTKGERTATVEYQGETATFDYKVKMVWWQWIIYILLFGWIWY